MREVVDAALSQLDDCHNALLARTRQFLLNPRGSHGPNPAASNVCTSFLKSYGAIVDRFGSSSRAMYLHLHDYCAGLMRVEARTPNYSLSRLQVISALLNNAVDCLSVQFYAMSDASRSPYVSQMVVDDMSEYYQYSAPEYGRTMGIGGVNVAPYLQEIDDWVLSGRTYMYCLAREQSFVLLNKPISNDEFFLGARVAGIVVKHPMLVEKFGLAALCAGELCCAKGIDGRPAAFLVSRTSGHFRPSAKSLEPVRRLLANKYPSASLYLIADEPLQSHIERIREPNAHLR